LCFSAAASGNDENAIGEAEKPPVLPIDLVEYRKSRLLRRPTPKAAGDAAEAQLGATEKFVVHFHFIYNNETQQQTEARADLHCPWCQLNCMTMFGLVKVEDNKLEVLHPDQSRKRTGMKQRHAKTFAE